jgi:hypothetical protein
MGKNAARVNNRMGAAHKKDARGRGPGERENVNQTFLLTNLRSIVTAKDRRFYSECFENAPTVR